MKATKLAAAIICLGSNSLAVIAAPNRKETFKDEMGTFIIGEHDGGESGAVTAAPNRSNEWETFKDEMGTFIIDEHDGGESGSKYQTMHVEFDDGLIYSLTDVDPSWVKSNGGNKGIRSGEARIRVRGVLSGTSFNLRGGAPEVAPDNRGRGNNRQLIEANTLTTGTRSVLAVRVVTGDGSAYGWPQEDLSNYVFGNDVDQSSLASVYKTCSYDQLNFVKANDRAMATSPGDEDATTDISNGVMTVKIDALPSDGEDAARQSIIQKLKEVFKTSPSNLADHVMFCFPPGVMENGGTARASVNHWYSMFSNEICNYPSFQAHEIGHNIDFGHSWETKEYDDTSGLMGYSFAQPIAKMCFNGAKSFQSTWYRSATHVINPSGAPRVNTEGCFAGELYGISQYTGSPDQPVLLKINEPQPEMVDFIVSFNENSGINSGTKEGANQVLIHTVENEGTVHNNSTLVAKLGAGESFTIENFGNSGKDVVITVDAISSSPSFATVRIEYGGEQCGCDSSLKTFQMRMKTDYYHEDVSWALTDTCTNSVVASRDAYSESDIKFVEETDWVKHFATEQFCLPHSAYNLELFDSYGDGICCDFGSGKYEVQYDGAVVASGSEYNSGESTLFGSGSCGSVCKTIDRRRKCNRTDGCSWDKFNGMCMDV